MNLGLCFSVFAAEPNVGYAYVGPPTLNLRKDLGPRAPTVGSAHHGDRLEVIETRRRFVRVRTPEKIEGWTDGNLLLTQQQMDELSTLAKKSAELPSQGTGTVFDALNMHTQPNRQSPTFSQIAQGASLEVIDHRMTPHGGAVPAVPKATVARKASPPKKAKSKDSKNVSALGLPPPPRPPQNWQDLSRPRASDLPGYTAQSAKPQNSGGDDWFLVRTKDRRAGWVLARMVSMSIPDDVAQYAEGHRITAYAPLGEAKDKEDATRHDWLWTTVSNGLFNYDFDSFRVFVWSAKRHHYETAFIERNVKGYYPVEVIARPGEEERAFSVILEDKDGQRYKRTYAFSGYRVKMISKEPIQPRAPLPEVSTAHNFDETPAPPPQELSWSDRFHAWREKWFRR